jgi:acyl-coenzyme A thioesterase PaaI-like protein
MKSEDGFCAGSGEVGEQREILGQWPGHCFGCSPNNPYGLQLRFTRAAQGCDAICTVPDRLCGFDGLVHGGILATLLDEAAAWAVIAHLGRLGLTREMTTRYLKPVPTSTEILLNGRVTSHDGHKAVVWSAVHAIDGTLLAESESSWAFAKLSRIASVAGVEENILQRFLDDCRGGGYDLGVKAGD